jgi:hypothetical protein
MRFRFVIPLFLLLFPLLSACSSDASDALSPGEVDSSLANQVIKVRGKISYILFDPGGLGGVFMKLGDGEVGVRIQDDIWTAFSDDERLQFKLGETVVAEGFLFPAGRELVIIHGKDTPTEPRY